MVVVCPYGSNDRLRFNVLAKQAWLECILQGLAIPAFCKSLSMKYLLTDRLREFLGETLGFLIGNLPNVLVMFFTLGIPPLQTD